MSIRWKCSQCGRGLSCTEQQVGRSVRCPGCGVAFTVPTKGDPEPVPHGGTGARLTIVAVFLLFLGVGAGAAWLVLADADRNSLAAGQTTPSRHDRPKEHTPNVVRVDGNPFHRPIGDTASETVKPTEPKPEPKEDPKPDPKEEPKIDPAPPVPPKDPETPTGPHSLRVASRGNVIVVSDRLNGKEVWHKEATAPVVFLAFSPDGKNVISRDEKGETCTWNAVSGDLVKREEPKPDTVATEKPKPEKPKLGDGLDPDELRASLLKVKELDFYPDVDKVRSDAISASLTGKDFAADQKLRIQFDTFSPPQFMAKVNGVLLKRAAEEGLPLVSKEYVRMPLEAAKTMDAMSKELRRRGFVSVPGNVTVSPKFGTPLTVVPAGTSAHASELEDWCKQFHVERYPGALNTFLQMLQVEDDATRMVLVQELGKCDNPVATRVLVTRAVFDLSPDVRQAAVDLLKKRNASTYRPQLLMTMRYPWAPAANHAAEALASLNDKKAIPELVALLDKPDPNLPVFDEKTKTGIVHEVVRINHMRNCFLCHAPSPLQNELVRGAVPRPGQPLPAMYYNAAQADFVQASITFLRQDFSVAQPVENANPWPTMQRFDYMVRTRKATEDEMATLRDSPSNDYPQRKAVLATLCQLSGKDLGSSTEAWKKYAAELAVGKTPEPSEPAKDKTDPKPAPPEKDKPQAGLTATSPDKSQIAQADGQRVRVLDATDKKILATFVPAGKVTVVAFASDGQRVFSGGEDKMLTAWSLDNGQAVFQASLGDVPTALKLSEDGKVLTCTLPSGTLRLDAASGKQLGKDTSGP